MEILFATFGSLWVIYMIGFFITFLILFAHAEPEFHPLVFFLFGCIAIAGAVLWPISAVCWIVGKVKGDK